MTDWQPIDTAPKDGARVLLWGDRRSVEVGRWEAEGLGPRWELESGWPIEDEFPPTHWMPLPEPPAKAGRKPEANHD